ncbi:MAG: topoisomerase IV, partial [Clostridia bacterium]|nr:topoisomerase IV [Clostridia bacterium]
NEIGLDGLRITIDLKRGVDPDKLMNRLFALTPLEDGFSCNFNVLIAGVPQVLGVRRLLDEWIAFRMESVRRRVYFDLQKAKDKLHLLKGLAKILLDIDKAIAIVRGTEEEAEVVPNLMIGFGIDEIQAEYVAEIKLRHLNREYILRRIEEIEKLEADIAEMDAILKSAARVRNIIIAELRDVMKKHGQPRRSLLLYASDLVQDDDSMEEVPNYPCTLFFTAEGYFKKITPQSLRMSGEQKLKEGDRIVQTIETDNRKDLLFFTNAGTVYKSKAADFGDTKASVLGDFVAGKLGFDDGEAAMHMVVTEKYTGYMLFFFENGKVAKVDMASYATKANRRKLIGAYAQKSPLVALHHVEEDREFMLISSSGRRLIVHTGAIAPKTTRDTQGVQVLTLKGQHRLTEVLPFEDSLSIKPARYRTKTIPAAGATPLAEDIGEQLSLL